MSLEDLRVAERTQGKGWGTSTSYRNATREDVLAAVRELGGVDVWFCHAIRSRWMRPTRSDVLVGLAYSDDGAVCRIDHPDLGCGPRLILPLDTGDTE